LDGSFNVMGAESLKVIDASALPDQPDGSRPMALVYMIAEMAADNIIDAYVTGSHARSILRSIGGQRRQYGYQT
jgi:choline dehydrogenase-like flavoprotein